MAVVLPQDMLEAMRRHGAEVARAARAGDVVEELRARQDLAAARAEIALHKILDNAPRIRTEQADALIRVITDRVRLGVDRLEFRPSR